MKTHPALTATRKLKNAYTRIIEGYLDADDKSVVRSHSSLSGGIIWEVDRSAIVHDEEINGTNGKWRLYLDPDADKRLILRAAVKDAEGEWCGTEGTMYCWERDRMPDGTVVITMKPCGSCPLPDNAGIFAP